MNKYMFMAAISAITLAGSANAEHHEGDKAAHHAKMQAHFDKKFAEVDGNKDGKISLDEKTAYVKTEFTKNDTNKDGFVDKQEAMAGWHDKKAKMGGRMMMAPAGMTPPVGVPAKQ